MTLEKVRKREASEEEKTKVCTCAQEAFHVVSTRIYLHIIYMKSQCVTHIAYILQSSELQNLAKILKRQREYTQKLRYEYFYYV